MAEGSSKGCPAAGSGDVWKSVLDDPDVVEVSAEEAAGWSSSGRQKRKLTQVVPSDIIELDANVDPDGVVIIDEKIENHKNKQAVIHIDSIKHAMSRISADPNATPVTKIEPLDALGDYQNNVAGPGSIPVTKVGPWDGLGGYDDNVASSSAILATDLPPWDGLTMLAPYYYDQFGVAPGEEHSKYYSNSSPLMESGSNFNSGANNYMGIPPGVEAVLPQETSAEMPHQPSQTEIISSEVHEKYKTFKRFDTVNDHGDHFYVLNARPVNQVFKQPSKAWVKRIQHEWKVLENDLPDMIYVRVYEDRMDLLRAVIVGPAGTPYHDGLFFFDVQFPDQYPSKPPLVNYRSRGLRTNPNLYECGKVCLSLLNTWAGSGCEKWNPSNSTMLQVLVSIQALVLNAKPFFNEPAHAMYANNTPLGEKLSMAYNENTFLLSCRTMQYSLRNPPKNFEDFVVSHFHNYGRRILKGCKSYMAGAQVGCLVGDGEQDVVAEGGRSCSASFKAPLKLLFADLLKVFAKIDVNCAEFQDPGAANATAGAPSSLKP